MDNREAGLLVILLAGIGLVVGLLILAGALSWFGRLPGDLRFGSQNARVYIPIASMLILSVAVSLLSYVVRRFL